MKFIIHYILLFLIPVYSLGQEPIVSLLNYNMLSIGNSKFFLGEHKWSLKISNQDTSLFMRKILSMMILIYSLTLTIK